MHLEHLEADGFRNLRGVSLSLAPRQVVSLIGPNGQGKTNLLEALYLCATGRSFRNAQPAEMITHHAPFGFVKALLHRASVRHQVAVHLSAGRRVIRVDDKALRQTSALLDLLNVVAFFPDDLKVIKGSPEERRRFLDRAIASGRAAFVEAALAYQRVLRSRNALLRADAALDQTLLAVLDEQLVQHGRVLYATRVSGLAQLMPWAVAYFEKLTNLSLEAQLSDGVMPGECCAVDNFAGAFAEALKRDIRRDRARGATSSGPHRSDLIVRIDGHDARSYASQGQQRAAILALKLAEMKALATRIGDLPILLLDDVSSELDAQRTHMLFAAVEELGAQTFVSTTGAVPLPVPASTLVVDVHEGHLVPRSF